ncbi:barstar family protein [Streptomyces sp. XD-27]|uniref:barstar family protein n=1 Tax=Streptomyces sp. XD-27 TaxID=3062779 RepID=UPI0026F41A4E|nr:barstar family protein [Streptomyces sp. XD-27]WKX70176.1 barstar family protein [Streptomyces sp. XD-27]
MVIDLAGVTTVRHLHVLLKQELGFPDFYGMNWDAFWDAITGLVELPRDLTFTGWSAFEATLPEDARIMRGLLDEYVAAQAHTPQGPPVIRCE